MSMGSLQPSSAAHNLLWWWRYSSVKLLVCCALHRTEVPFGCCTVTVWASEA